MFAKINNLKTPPNNQPIHKIGDTVFIIKDGKICKSFIKGVLTADEIFTDYEAETGTIKRIIKYQVENGEYGGYDETAVFTTEKEARTQIEKLAKEPVSDLTNLSEYFGRDSTQIDMTDEFATF